MNRGCLAIVLLFVAVPIGVGIGVGIFEKKAHKLEGEQEMNSSTVGLVNDDGLAWRQNFCNIANSIWGTSMWCEPSESVVGADLDGDGDAIDRNEGGENSGVESTSQEGGQE